MEELFLVDRFFVDRAGAFFDGDVRAGGAARREGVLRGCVELRDGVVLRRDGVVERGGVVVRREGAVLRGGVVVRREGAVERGGVVVRREGVVLRGGVVVRRDGVVGVRALGGGVAARPGVVREGRWGSPCG